MFFSIASTDVDVIGYDPVVCFRLQLLVPGAAALLLHIQSERGGGGAVQ